MVRWFPGAQIMRKRQEGGKKRVLCVPDGAMLLNDHPLPLLYI